MSQELPQLMDRFVHQVAQQMDPSWAAALQPTLESERFQHLAQWVARERQQHVVYPPQGQVFTALRETPLDRVRVVIVGQDPYHGQGQAHGLSFSVQPGVKPPPSLVNIFKELSSDCGMSIPATGCLLPWAHEGVLLLNAVLTVREGEPGSHAGQGWESFTDEVLRILWERPQPVAFLLWGKWAAQKLASACAQDAPQHLVLKAPHPSPYSAYAGFFGCHHFSQVNLWLQQRGEQPIAWDSIASSKSSL